MFIIYQKEIKKNNESQILQHIFILNKTFTIPQISEIFNFSFPTVKRIFQRFLEKNIILEVESLSQNIGRKPKEYIYNEGCIYSLGIQLKDTELSIVLLNASGKVIKEHKIPFSFVEEAFIKSFSKIILSFIDTLQEKEKNNLIGIGVSFPGILDLQEDFIEIFHKKFFNYSYLKNELEKSINLPVFFENEANLSVLAESFKEENLNNFSIMSLTINRNVNMSIFNRDSCSKKFQFRASRVHHMIIEKNGKKCFCNEKGCWGEYISEYTLLCNFQKYYPEISFFEDIFERKYFLKDKGKLLFEEYLEYLSIGIKNLIYLSNPEKLIICGKIGRYKELFIDLLLEKIYSERNFYRGKETISFSTYYENSSLIGAGLFPIIDIFI